ncbi:putative magnesium transporter NIPA8 [Diplonema papillatum]|nr:putative magnesium transporter NIPA8 [Diplonema papillatum]
METWWIGAVAAAVGSTGAGIGENLVRLSYSKLGDVAEDALPPLLERPLWVCGWLLTTVLTSVCALVGLSFAPLQLVMPIGGLHILVGVAVAHVLNNESLSAADLLGAGLVCFGVMVVLIGVDKNSPHVTPQNLSMILGRPEALLFFSSCAVCMVVFFFCSKPPPAAAQKAKLQASVSSEVNGTAAHIVVRVESVVVMRDSANGSSNGQLHEAPEVVDAGFRAKAEKPGGGGQRRPGHGPVGAVLRRLREAKRFFARAVRPVAAPALAGFLSAASNFAVKIALSLASAADGWAVLFRAEQLTFWMFCLLSIAFGIGQATTLNRALMHFPAVVVVPTANAVLITVGSAGGLVFSSEVTANTGTSLVVGISLVVAGIVLLASRDSTAASNLQASDQFEHSRLVCDCNQSSILGDDQDDETCRELTSLAYPIPVAHELPRAAQSPDMGTDCSASFHGNTGGWNLSFASETTCGNRSFGGYCENISFNRLQRRDAADELKKTLGRLSTLGNFHLPRASHRPPSVFSDPPDSRQTSPLRSAGAKQALAPLTPATGAGIQGGREERTPSFDFDSDLLAPASPPCSPPACARPAARAAGEVPGLVGGLGPRPLPRNQALSALSRSSSSRRTGSAPCSTRPSSLWDLRLRPRCDSSASDTFRATCWDDTIAIDE